MCSGAGTYAAGDTDSHTTRSSWQRPLRSPSPRLDTDGDPGNDSAPSVLAGLAANFGMLVGTLITRFECKDVLSLRAFSRQVGHAT
jgi:hypothetical protein